MIQIDMPMPTNCLDCPACNEYLMCAIPVNGRKWGENDVREFGQGRPEWCPMQEQEAAVRCKDCKHWKSESDLFGKCEQWHLSGVYSADWFCADGEKKE
jgi:hypothetical protein